MKKLLTGLFLMISVLSFSERVVKLTEIVIKQDIVYVGQEESPYTGIVETYDKNGKLDGLAKKYYPNGKIEYEETYKNNILDGTAKMYGTSI